MGIEPTSSAWKAEVLPLNYTRRSVLSGRACLASIVCRAADQSALEHGLSSLPCHSRTWHRQLNLVEGGGLLRLRLRPAGRTPFVVRCPFAPLRGANLCSVRLLPPGGLSSLPCHSRTWHRQLNLVEGGGFEPPKAVPADLQSAPFGRSGTPPFSSALLCFSALRLSTVSGQNLVLSSASPEHGWLASLPVWQFSITTSGWLASPEPDRQSGDSQDLVRNSPPQPAFNWRDSNTMTTVSVVNKM